ncbi:MAG: lamin tail domain-containing protein [Actinomycetota bacterium]
MTRRRAPILGAVLALALIVTGISGAMPTATTGASSASASLAVDGVVISQVYGGGGNAGATYKNDFIELFNPTAATVSLAGASVQYASSAGITWQTTALSGSIPPGAYYLVQEAVGAGGTTALPAPDASGTIPMAAAASKVALVASTAALTGSCPVGTADLVGFGTANCFEGVAAAPAPSNTTADLRAKSGCQDTNSNSADFAAGAPAPRNSASPTHSCELPPPTITCGGNLTTPQGTPVSRQVSATDSDGTVVSISIDSVTPASGAGSFSIADLAPATAPGGTATATLQVDGSLAAGTYTVQLRAANDDSPPQTATCSLSVTVTAPPVTLTIGAVQGSVPDSADGATFASPYAGQTVNVQGVVTERTREGANNGFYLQNTAATADADPSSSDGIFVFMGGFTSLIGGYVPVVGDEISLTGKVSEFFGFTELGSASATKVGTGSVTPFAADPPSGGADAARYWERHEGMQATVPTDSVVDSPTHLFASTQDTEFYAIAPTSPVAQRADPYAQRAYREAHPLDDVPGTFNGNGFRILITDEGVKVADHAAKLTPVRTFQRLAAPVTGGVFFAFGKYSVSAASQPQVADGADPAQNDPPQVFDRAQAYSIANFNMQNLYDYRDDPNDGCDFFGNSGCPGVSPPFDYPPASDAEYQQRESEIAHQIVVDLRSPDVIVVAEAEDQGICTAQAGALVCGTADNAEGQPDVLQELALEIQELGGPAYSTAFDRNGTDARGIICAFMYRTDRVQLLPASAGDAVLGSSPTVSYRAPGLAYSTDVSNPKALNAVLPADATTDADGSNVFTRAVQVAHFAINPTTQPGTPSDLWIAANHFSSGPDTRVLQRTEQARYNAAVVKAIQGQEPNAKVMVAGDLNDFPRPDDPFLPGPSSDQFASLYEAGPHNLYDTVIAENPAAAYSYVFDGRAQDLDHQFVTDSFFADLNAANETHINSDWPGVPGSNRGTSDHDPMVSRWALSLDHPPTVNAGGPYTVDEGGSVTLSASGDDPDGDALTYAWDLNSDDTFETTGQTVAFAAGDGPATQTVSVQATDPSGLSSTGTATVTLANVAPTATFNAPAGATVGVPFTISLSSPHDPSAADSTAGFAYAFDCGTGYGSYGVVRIRDVQHGRAGRRHRARQDQGPGRGRQRVRGDRARRGDVRRRVRDREAVGPAAGCGGARVRRHGHRSSPVSQGSHEAGR